MQGRHAQAAPAPFPAPKARRVQAVPWAEKRFQGGLIAECRWRRVERDPELGAQDRHIQP